MKTILHSLLSFLLLIGAVNNLLAQNQVRIKLYQPPLNKLGAGDLWNLELDNTTGMDMQIYLTGTATEEKDGLIIEGKSKVFTLKPGRSNYKYNDFPNAEVKYNNGKYKEIILRTGNAPEGNYTICVTAYNEQGEVVGMENCIIHPVKQMGSITLISPEDGAEVNPEQPIIFSWTPLPGAKNYTLKIVEMRSSQSPEVAMKENKAFFEKNSITTTLFQYLLSEKKFELGKKYAWGVMSGNTVSNSSYFMIMFGDPHCAAASYSLNPVQGEGCCFDVVIRTTETWFSGFSIESSSGTSFTAYDNTNDNNTMYSTSTSVKWIAPLSGYQKFPAHTDITLGQICFSGNIVSQQPFVVKWSTSWGQDWKCESKSMQSVDCGSNCCNNFFSSIENSEVNYTGTLALISPVFVTSNPITKVKTEVISCYKLIEGTSCSGSEPVFPLIRNASLTGFTTALLYTNEALLTSATGINLNNTNPINLTLEFGPPTQQPCTDKVKFCVRYTFTDSECRSCDTVLCYGFIRGFSFNGIKQTEKEHIGDVSVDELNNNFKRGRASGIPFSTSFFENKILHSIISDCPDIQPKIISSFVFFPKNDTPSCSITKNSGSNYTSSCILACENSYVTYSTASNPNSTYHWNVTGNVINVTDLTQNSITVLWGAHSNGNVVTVSETNNNCTETAEICVDVINSPVAQFTPSATSVCLGQPISFTNNSLNGLSYIWDFGDNTTSSEISPTHNYSSSGTYNVILRAINECGCENADTVQVIVNEGRGPDINCPTTICAGKSKTYYTTVNCGTPSCYIWTVEGANTWTVSSDGKSVDVNWGNGPQGKITLEISSGCSCEPSITCSQPTTVTVPIISPNANIEGNSPVCINSIETYSAPLWPGTYYDWSVTGGQIISGMNTNQITVKWSFYSPGTITLTYHNIIHNCGGSGSKSVEVRDKFSIDGPTEACFGESNSYNYNASNTIGQPVTCNWDVTGGVINSGQGTNTINVSWVSPTGPYIVKATNNSFCNTEEIINVNVIQIEPPDSISGPMNVCSGIPYTYSTQLNNPDNEVLWQVNGGTIQGSPNANPVTVIWTGNGSISVSEKSTSSPFCTSTFIDTNVSVISITVISGSQTVCVDGFETYTAGSNNYAPAINYDWRIDPPSLGSIIEGQGSNSIQVRWNGIPNNFTLQSVTIYLNVCGSTTPLTHAVTIKPPLNPQINPVSMCPGNTAVLTTSETYSSYIWQDAALDTISENQTVVINSPGLYYLTVTDQTGCPGKTLINVPVGTSPTASISSQGPRVYCPNATVNTTLFALEDVGYHYQWLWTVNNVTTPVGTDISTYGITSSTQFGSYTVSVTGANGCIDTSLPILIAEIPCLPGQGECTPQSYQADFTWAYLIENNIQQCNKINFTNSSSSNFNLGNWNYGDGNTGTGNPTSHTYSNAGFYDVQMNGSVPQQNGNGICVVSVIKSITVPIAANFSYVNNCGTVTVTDLSTHISGANITSTEWSRSNDNVNFTTFTPPLSLSQSGTYYIKLRISNGSCFSEKTETITNNTPSAISFNVTPNPACANTPIEFTAPPGMFEYSWDFGDGSASYERNPKHTFTNTTNTDTTYNVVLTAVDMNGCSILEVQTITVNPDPGNPVISEDTSICQNDTPHTLNAPVGSNYHQWYNSNGVISGANGSSYGVTESGSYYVTYTSNNCQIKTASVNVTVNPLPKAIITPSRDPNICYCSGPVPQMQLTAYNRRNYSFAWKVNGVPQPGNNTLNMLSLQPNNSPYEVLLTVTDTTTGCTASTSLTINVYGCPDAPNIVNQSEQYCEGNEITFEVDPNNTDYQYIWSNGVTGPSMTTSLPGTYYVTAYDQNGCSSKSLDGYQIFNKPDASLFPVGCDTLCDTTKLPGPKGYSSYKWYRNGELVGTQQELDMNPLLSGTYTLEIISVYGCTTLAGPYNITAKDCIDRPQTCCENSLINIQSGPSYRSGTIYEINSHLSYSPERVKKISATIVGAQISGSSCSPNGEIPAYFSDAQNISGPITNLTGPVSSSYSQYSKEVIWGSNSGTAYDLSSSSIIKMGINLPANTCPDVLTLNVKYSFFNENCQVCDTVIEYKIPRRIIERCGCIGWKSDKRIEYKGGSFEFGCNEKKLYGNIPAGEISWFGEYECSPGCNPTYEWKLYSSNSFTFISTGTSNLLPLSINLPNSETQYRLAVKTKCGDVVCPDSCIVFLETSKGVECCGSWESKKVTYWGPYLDPIFNDTIKVLKKISKLGKTLDCGQSTEIKKGKYFITLPKYNCSSKECGNATYSWTLYRDGSFVVQNTSASFEYNFQDYGNYTLKYYAYCGGSKPCDSCIVTFKFPNPKAWGRFNQTGLLTGEDDPINVSLNIAREKLAKTEIGKLIENWYESLNKTNWTDKILEDSSNINLAKQLSEIGRRVVVKEGTLTKNDIPIIENTLRTIEKVGVAAPEGLIDNVMKILNSSIGKSWDDIIDKMKEEK